MMDIAVGGVTTPVTITNNARRMLESAGRTEFELLQRHAANDWGDVSEEDKYLNQLALRSLENEHTVTTPIISTYRLAGDRVVWIVTVVHRNQDGNQTLMLLPAEAKRFRSLF